MRSYQILIFEIFVHITKVSFSRFFVFRREVF
jgi:hypothetical protein